MTNKCTIQDILKKLQDNCITNNKSQQTLFNDVEMRSIKLIDIGYITCIYFFIGHYLAKFLDSIYNKYLGVIDPNKKYSQSIIIAELILQMAVTGILVYFGRNLVYYIPFPLNHYDGFDHMKVKEVTGAGFLSTFLVMFQANMASRISYLKDNF